MLKRAAKTTSRKQSANQTLRFLSISPHKSFIDLSRSSIPSLAIKSGARFPKISAINLRGKITVFSCAGRCDAFLIEPRNLANLFRWNCCFIDDDDYDCEAVAWRIVNVCSSVLVQVHTQSTATNTQTVAKNIRPGAEVGRIFPRWFTSEIS